MNTVSLDSIQFACQMHLALALSIYHPAVRLIKKTNAKING
jgi:hypothetical protein